MLSVAEALARILTDDHLTRLQSRGVEQVNLPDALGCVVSEDQVARVDVPPWDNSAMDGYALCHADALTDKSLRISQVIPAGISPKPLEAGTAARIFTGAPIPEGADTVEMQENTEAKGESVLFTTTPALGSHIRKRGEDIAKGSTVVAAGTLLKAAHLGLLASIGVGTVIVRKPLRVALLSTGDELVDPLESKTPLQDGEIYNSNRYLLRAMLQELACEIIDGGMVRDEQAATEQQLQYLSKKADVLICTGGVSVGDEDHVKAAVESIGQLDLWKIAIKPGKPLAFGCVGGEGSGATFFGLPGNPVSAFVTFLLFVKPYLLKAQGAEKVEPDYLMAEAGFDWPPIPELGASKRKPLKREEYLRARLDGDGKTVTLFPNQSSGALSSLAWANCLVLAPVGEVITRGDSVRVLLL